MHPSGSTQKRKTENDINVINSSAMSTPTTSEGQVRAFICVKCGKIFIKPIQLTNPGKASVDKYCACPHCFSRVSSSDTIEKSIDQTLPEDHRIDSKETATTIEGAKPNSCGHFVGYLKTLSKDAQLPEECLVCASLIKCKH